MSSPPPVGSDPNIPPPPPPPGVPPAQPDRGAGPALAGFLWSLAGFCPSMVAALSYIATAFAIFSGPGKPAPGYIAPGLSMSAIVPLILVAFPAALVELRFSFRGRHSSSRRGLAIAGRSSPSRPWRPSSSSWWRSARPCRTAPPTSASNAPTRPPVGPLGCMRYAPLCQRRRRPGARQCTSLNVPRPFKTPALWSYHSQVAGVPGVPSSRRDYFPPPNCLRIST